MPESKNSPRRLKARERQLLALELRKEGATYEEIAVRVGYAGRQGAALAIEAALKRVLERPAAEVRKLDLERLDMMLLCLMPRIRSGDWQGVNSALRIMARRAKLLGLDAPIKIEAEVEHIERRDLSKVPKEDLERVLAEADRILDGDDS